MPLTFAAITPHPPVMVPGVGSAADLQKCRRTVTAMNRLALEFAATKPDHVLVVSPHAPSAPTAFAVNIAPSFEVSLLDFGVSKPVYKIAGDRDFATQLLLAADKTPGLAIAPVAVTTLDHGVAAPFSYLLAEHSRFKLLPLSFSDVSREEHFRYGNLLGKIIAAQSDQIAFIASGDLSHRLTTAAPAGFSPQGKIFDQQLVAALKEMDVKKIMKLDENLVADAGECGLRSILILMGLLDKHTVKPEILSYEGPFGVGYLVANFKFK